MNSATFERSLASIDRSIKTLGQEMSIVRNRGREWGTTTDGLRTKQETLTRLLSSQEVKVRALRAAYESSKQATGENSAATERLAAQLNRAVAEYTRTETEISDVTAALRRQEEELRRSQSSWQRAGESMQKVGETMKRVGSSMKSIGQSMSLYVTAPIVGLGVGAAKAAIEFESAFAGVRKTVDTSEEGFKKLEKGIREMATTLPTSAKDIAAVAESAGQLGIAEENILSFTRTVVDLGESTNMSREQAATEFAKFANITGMAQKDFDKLGSSVVAMGNNFATTESDITAMAMRLAGAGTQVGMSEADIIGLATALSSVGIEAEMGGSAISRVMVSMQVATSTGFTKVQDLSKQTGYSLRDLQMMASHSGKAFGNLAEDLGMTKKELTTLVNAGVDLEGFSKVAGMTGEEFKKAFEKDAIGAIGAFINGLGNAEDKGDTAINMLQEMGINSVLLRDSLLRAGGASELFGDAVKLSNEAWEENTALTKEAEQRYKTTESQLKMLKNKFTEIGISMKNVLIPPLLKIADVLGPIAEKFSNLSDGAKTVIVVIAGMVAAIGPVLVVVGMLVSSIGSILTALAPVALAIGEAGGLMTVLGTAMTGIVAPIGVAILAIGSMAAVFVGLYKNHEGFRNVVDSTWSAIKDAISSTMSGIVSFVQSMGDQLSTFWSENQESIKEAASNVWSAISTVIDVALKVISGVMSVVWPIIKALVVSTWEAIKNVIEGVTKVITGIIKTFSSLLTGDWKGVWEGIKQILSGALEAVWGAINLYFVGKLLGPLKSFGPAAKSLVTSAWNGIKGIITGVLDVLKSSITGSFNLYKTSISTILNATKTVISSIWNGIKTIVTTVMGGIKNTVTSSWNGIKSNTSTILNGIKNIITNIFNMFKSIVSKAMDGVATAVDVGWGKAASFLHSINLVSVGKHIIQGLINGIGSMMDAVKDKVKSVATGVTSTIKKALDIRSPSRVTTKLGEHTGQGFVNGISKKEKAAQTAANKLAASAKKEFNTKMSNLSLKFKAEKIDITEYVKSLEAMKTQYANVPNAVAKINAQIVSLNKKHAKEVFDVAKSSIEDKVKMNEMSLTQELAAWEKLQKNYKKGSDERKQIDQNIYETKKQIHNQLTSLNDEYVTKVNDANERLAASEKALKDEYKKSVAERTASLISFAGIFDEVAQSSDITGQKLLENLQGQVAVFETWSKNIQLLAKKGIDKGLLEELRQMGPKAAPEIAALTTLTDQELTQYAKLWKDKNVLARTQAESELAQMNKDTKKKIKELTAETKKELDEYKKEWASKIKEIRTGTTDEFVTMKTSMKSIGKDTIKGLMAGMEDMEKPLQKKAQSIADSISKTIASALKIKSPSRVMMGLGKWIPAGLAEGMEQNMSAITNAAQKMANATMPNINPGGYSSGFGGSSVSNIDNTRSYQPVVNNNFYAPVASPSELARKSIQAQRQLAMEWGV
ncbi:phage tail tape measure protein [Viridibacillus sp. FSL R5-0477]|nr:phage tail tape measure protein [Viridibacillus arenosi]